MKNGEVPSSFRDPAGFLFKEDGLIYRQINHPYQEDYEHLMKSGLYRALVDEELLVPHTEVEKDRAKSDKAYKIIKPQLIPFISYPYEWCFSQLKDAALLTLTIQKKALKFGMSLKDCSAYNVQFHNGKPIFIDTLSFQRYRSGTPWVAYRQFCQHFLAPLALKSLRDTRLNQLLKIYIDGPPLDLASSLLPFRSRLKFSLLSHIHLHAKSQERFANKPVKPGRAKMSRVALLGLIDNLEGAIKKMKWHPKKTEWGDYYQATNYDSHALGHKKELVEDFLEMITPRPQSVWDLGANTGLFSRIASKKGMRTLSLDIDPVSVEKNYLECCEQREPNILPLLFDLTNPSPSIGWENKERMSLLERGPADTALALALLHHLAISNNVPFSMLAPFFSKICNWLIIEYIPKSDSQVKRLLATREDIFTDYKKESFESEFGKFFDFHAQVDILNSSRTLYLMEKKPR